MTETADTIDSSAHSLRTPFAEIIWRSKVTPDKHCDDPMISRHSLKNVATNPEPYGTVFYDNLRTSARRSAAAVVPLLVDAFRPTSVIDVGCGTGTWLAVFQEYGLHDLLGIDGAWVNPDAFEVRTESFRAVDLRTPFISSRRFDLVVSLEVAEHLPLACASPFVESLTSCGDLILFSAACPHQGGTDHLNEQWPDYWATLFEARGYHAVDWLRSKIWTNDDVAWWYAQNALLFVNSTALARYPALRASAVELRQGQLSLVHPGLYLDLVRQLALAKQQGDLRQRPLRHLLRALCAVVFDGIQRRARAVFSHLIC